MICAHCRKPNRDDRRFCGACGSALTLSCSACEFVNEATDRFCGGCGITTSTAAAEASETGGVPMLSMAELQALLAEVPSAAMPVVALPQGPIGQDDLDRLFGGIE